MKPQRHRTSGRGRWIARVLLLSILAGILLGFLLALSYLYLR